jgi:hypothetical protein
MVFDTAFGGGKLFLYHPSTRDIKVVLRLSLASSREEQQEHSNLLAHFKKYTADQQRTRALRLRSSFAA